MKPNDEWDREAFLARQIAIIEKYTKVKLKPTPKPAKPASVKAREAWEGKNKPLAAVLQDVGRAQEVATATLRDRRTQEEKDQDERIKSEHDRAMASSRH